MAPAVSEKIMDLLPVLLILIPLGIHFFFISLVFLHVWLAYTYAFNHIFFILFGIWACHAKKDVIPVFAFIGVIVVSAIMDIILLGLNFSSQQDINGGGQDSFQRTWQLSAGMMIINFFFKPVTVLLAVVSIYLRSGGNLGPLSKQQTAEGGGKAELDYHNYAEE